MAADTVTSDANPTITSGSGIKKPSQIDELMEQLDLLEEDFDNVVIDDDDKRPRRGPHG